LISILFHSILSSVSSFVEVGDYLEKVFLRRILGVFELY
jgi:hypothetical protein